MNKTEFIEWLRTNDRPFNEKYEMSLWQANVDITGLTSRNCEARELLQEIYDWTNSKETKWAKRVEAWLKKE